MENYLEIFLWKNKNLWEDLLKIKMQESTCRELLGYFMNCHADARSKILHARSKLEKSQKHSGTLTLSTMNICQGQHETLRNFHPQENESDFFQMEAWNTHKLSLSGNEIFSSGSMKHSELLTPRKMDMNNSHMETWWILTFRKMKMKILTLRCMLCVVQERKTWPTNILKSFRRQDAHMFFFNVWCSVLRTRKRICVSHNKGYTLLFQCVLFFPQCLALCEKNERYQMNKWMFFKMTDDVMPAVFFTKTCAVYDKQMELIILWMFLMACAGFWLRKTYDILRSGTLWRLLKKMNFCWPFFPINFVVSWFIDYCSLPVLASRNEHACETPPHGFWTIAN